MPSTGERILVCGGRDYSDQKQLFRVLDRLPKPALLIAGGANGADELARRWAEARGVPAVIYPANWKGEGRAAGSIRNSRMLEEARPTQVIAFPGSSGTADMVRKARAAAVPVSFGDTMEMLS